MNEAVLESTQNNVIHEMIVEDTPYAINRKCTCNEWQVCVSPSACQGCGGGVDPEDTARLSFVNHVKESGGKMKRFAKLDTEDEVNTPDKPPAPKIIDAGEVTSETINPPNQDNKKSVEKITKYDKSRKQIEAFSNKLCPEAIMLLPDWNASDAQVSKELRLLLNHLQKCKNCKLSHNR